MSGNVNWNTNEYEARSGFEVLPKGRYLAIVDNSELKKTKDQKGQYLEFTFTCLKEPAKNRKLWARLNVHNPSEKAQRIGREQFNALALACGKEKGVSDSTQLHNSVVVLIVDIQRGEGGNADQNRVTGFLKPSADDAKTQRPKTETEERRAANTQQQKPKPPREPGSDDMEDDIPF